MTNPTKPTVESIARDLIFATEIEPEFFAYALEEDGPATHIIAHVYGDGPDAIGKYRIDMSITEIEEN